MEQQQVPSVVAAADLGVPSLPAVEIHAGLLPELLVNARELAGPEGAQAQRAVEVLLAGLQPTARDGELLLGLLEAGSFSGLRGEDGTPTRARAIEALLRLGFPWSIQVQPEDLAWYREHQRAGQRTRQMILLGILGVEVVGAVAYWFLF